MASVSWVELGVQFGGVLLFGVVPAGVWWELLHSGCS